MLSLWEVAGLRIILFWIECAEMPVPVLSLLCRARSCRYSLTSKHVSVKNASLSSCSSSLKLGTQKIPISMCAAPSMPEGNTAMLGLSWALDVKASQTPHWKQNKTGRAPSPNPGSSEAGSGWKDPSRRPSRKPRRKPTKKLRTVRKFTNVAPERAHLSPHGPKGWRMGATVQMRRVYLKRT